MRSEKYYQLLREVMDLMLSREHGEIGLLYIELYLYGLADEKDKMEYLESVLKTRREDE